MTKPSLKSNNIKALLEKNYYHRGKQSRGCYENTMSAFKGALEDQMGIELDVHMTLDRKLVVMHDYDTKRMCDQNLIIKQTNRCALEQLKIKDSDETLPRFEDVLALVDGKQPLIIEIKNTNFKCKETAEVVYQALKDYPKNYFIASFNPIILYHFRRFDASIPRLSISQNFKQEDIPLFHKIVLKYFLFNFLARPNAISFLYTDSNLIYRLNLLWGCHSLAYTVPIAKIEDYQTTFESMVIE